MTGIDIMLDNDTFKSTYQILSEISNKWSELSDIDQASLLELLAGKNRSNVLAAILQSPDILKSAHETSLNSEGSAQKELETYLDSIEGRTSQLKASFQQLSNDVISSDVVKFFVTLADNIVRASDAMLTFSTIFEGIAPDSNWAKYFDDLKAFPSIIAAISAGISIKNKGQKADGILGINMPFARATEHLHKPENCWKSLTPSYQSAA